MNQEEMNGSLAVNEKAYRIVRLLGKGIASALLSEALNRTKALGAKKADVISNLPFYENPGFEKAQHYCFYRKV